MKFEHKLVIQQRIVSLSKLAILIQPSLMYEIQLRQSLTGLTESTELVSFVTG